MLTFYWSGLESPGDWDGHQGFFGLDGQDIQYMVSSFLDIVNQRTLIF